MTKKILILSLTILAALYCLAQKPGDRDSLYKILSESKTDSAVAANYLSLARLYLTSNFDSSVIYADKAEAIAENAKLTALIISCKVIKGFNHSIFRKDTLALKYISEALDLALSQEDKPGAHSKDQDENYKRVREVYFYYSMIYLFIGEYQKSIDYLRKVKQLNSVNPSEFQLAMAEFVIGQCNYEMGKLDSAYTYVSKAARLNESFFNTWGFYHVLTGYIYRKSGKLDTALHHSRLGLELTKQQPLDVFNLAKANIGMAQCFYENQIYDSAKYFALEAYHLTTTSDFPDQRLIASDLLAKIFKEKNEIDSAFKFLTIAGTIKDSLYLTNKIQADQRISFDQRIQEEQQLTQKQRSANKIRLLILGVVLLAAVSIAMILFRNNKRKQKDKDKIEKAYGELKSTQAQLIQSEKMASLGELTAGIAHEIQNPLNFVNNFSEINKELLIEMKDEMNEGNLDSANAIANNVIDNEEKINHHGKRADTIVKGMLQHSRSSTGQKQPTDINALADEYLRLAYHGLRAKDNSFNAIMNTDFDESLGEINIISQDIGRVLLNLYSNAFYAVTEKKNQQDKSNEPTVSVSTKKFNGKVEIQVADNGDGIPEKVLDKIFQPFFTTKAAGQGTGLGLSLAYDIIKAHGGEIRVNTKEGEGTEFTIELPIS